MTIVSFATMQFVAVLAANRVLTGKATIQAFERPYLLAAANKLTAIAGLIFTDYCLLDTRYLAHIGFVIVFVINAIDYQILYAKQTILLS